jgi:uncharacterized membrane protein YqgA involved in biofilm formation
MGFIFQNKSKIGEKAMFAVIIILVIGILLGTVLTLRETKKVRNLVQQLEEKIGKDIDGDGNVGTSDKSKE